MTNDAGVDDPTVNPDEPLHWADAPQMSPVDAVMWRGDADRRLRSTICMLEIYDKIGRASCRERV